MLSDSVNRFLVRILEWGSIIFQLYQPAAGLARTNTVATGSHVSPLSIAHVLDEGSIVLIAPFIILNP